MENLVLFVFTTLSYWMVYRFFSIPVFDNKSFLNREKTLFSKRAFRSLGITALLCLPVNINGNVFTIFGNVHSTGVKSVFSFLSLYQSAEYDTFSIFGSLYQKAAKGDAGVLAGLSAYQNAGEEALILFGVSFYQKSDKKDSIVGVGLSGVQKSKYRNVVTVAGISFYQEAKKDVAAVFVGVSIIQKSSFSRLSVGLAGYQYGSQSSKIGIGLALAQISEEISENWLAMSLYQRAGNKNRAFAVRSKLRAE